MADLETPSNAQLVMDRGLPLGNSLDVDGRRALHVKIKNKLSEPIPVEILPTLPSLVPIYSEALAVPSNVETDLVTYTVPALTKTILKRASGNADVIAEYRFKVDGALAEKKFSYFTQYFVDFDFSDGLAFNAGQILKLSVINNRPSAGNFNGSFILQEVPL